MKLATRLIAVTAGTVFLAASVAGGLLVRLERRQLLADEVADARLFTRSLQVSVENAMRDGQDPDIAELLARLERVAQNVDVFVFAGEGGPPRQTSAGSDPTDPVATQVRHRVEAEDGAVWVLRLDEAPPRLLTGVSLRTDAGDPIGTLVVARPLSALQADMRTTTALIAMSALGFAAATTLVMVVVLRREVTGPLSRIAAATAVLGRELDAPLDLEPQRSTELDAVRLTLGRLQRRLIDARDARAVEAQQREQLERHLREADKLIAVGQLAAGVAHEIGSPLQVLVGRTQLLARDEGYPDEVRRHARLIAEQATRIAGIVERLQDVSRRRAPRMELGDLSEPVRKVMWLLEPEARRRQVDLAWRVPEDPVRARFDEGEVQQVALNLVLNALQATEAGGRVGVAVEAAGDEARLEVADTGRGIEPSLTERVFEPFFTTRLDAGGTGLGLAVVKSIADRHRARLRLASEVGVGTSVTVAWPREER